VGVVLRVVEQLMHDGSMASVASAASHWSPPLPIPAHPTRT
jgi:hypothetical protein